MPLSADELEKILEDANNQRLFAFIYQLSNLFKRELSGIITESGKFTAFTGGTTGIGSETSFSARKRVEEMKKSADKPQIYFHTHPSTSHAGRRFSKEDIVFSTLIGLPLMVITPKEVIGIDPMETMEEMFDFDFDEFAEFWRGEESDILEYEEELDIRKAMFPEGEETEEYEETMESHRKYFNETIKRIFKSYAVSNISQDVMERGKTQLDFLMREKQIPYNYPWEKKTKELLTGFLQSKEGKFPSFLEEYRSFYPTKGFEYALKKIPKTRNNLYKLLKAAEVNMMSLYWGNALVLCESCREIYIYCCNIHAKDEDEYEMLYDLVNNSKCDCGGTLDLVVG